MQTKDTKKRKRHTFEHYPIPLAKDAYRSGQRARYKVTTINWTFASDHKGGPPDYSTVHRNVYHYSLRSLIQFIRDTDDVAEDIISIEAE